MQFSSGEEYMTVHRIDDISKAEDGNLLTAIVIVHIPMSLCRLRMSEAQEYEALVEVSRYEPARVGSLSLERSIHMIDTHE